MAFLTICESGGGEVFEHLINMLLLLRLNNVMTALTLRRITAEPKYFV